MKNKNEIIINHELIECLTDQLKCCIYSSLEDESFKYPYIIGFSEIIKIINDKYNIKIDIYNLDEKINDEMFKEIVKGLGD